jgi:hypothetical protein
MNMRRLVLIFTVLLCFSAVVNAGLVVGNHTEGNCYPFSCFASDEGVVYQEIYSATAFSGPITISSLSFYLDTDWMYGNTGRDSATYTIHLSTTPVAVDGMTAPLDNNVGADNQFFGTFALTSGLMPDVLTFAGTPFSYDPSSGNLLMQVDVSDVTGYCGYCSALQSDGDGASLVVRRAYTNMYDSPVNQTRALVTGFNADAPVPEPGTLALLGGGLLGLVAFCRRKRA